jgi:antitoxin ParD1/3/4
MRAMTVSLSPQQVTRIEDAVESGAYASNSEVVRDALRLWEQREAVRAAEVARFKTAYDDGMASGEGRRLDAETFLAELKAEKARHG